MGNGMRDSLEYITSEKNHLIKLLIKLRDKRARDREGLYIIEGYRELLRALEGNIAIESLFICPDFFLKDNEHKLIDSYANQGARIIRLSPEAFQRASYRDRPDGLLAIAKQKHLSLDNVIIGVNPLIAIVEKIEKPGNLGTILRACDASGVDLVIVCDPVTDIYNPNVVRASIGTLFTQTIVQASTKDVITWLEKHRIDIVATSPSANTCYTDINYLGPIAIAMGCEQYGLSDYWLETAHTSVFIPMHGHADSLNVAIATSLMLYEVVRQRGL